MLTESIPRDSAAVRATLLSVELGKRLADQHSKRCLDIDLVPRALPRHGERSSSKKTAALRYALERLRRELRSSGTPEDSSKRSA